MSSNVVLTINKVQGPIAEIYSTADYVKPLDVITFNGSTSEDISGRGIMNYTWNFDDGTMGYGEEVEHNYSKSGEYNVTLTVIDSSDLSDMTFKIIQVDDHSPSPSFICEDNKSVELDKDSQGRYIADEEQLVFFNATMTTDTLDGSTKVELDTSDPRTFIWDLGKGEEPQNGPEVNSFYRFFRWEDQKDDPTFTISLNVTDKAGNYKVIEKDIVIRDKIPPTPLINPLPAISVGEAADWNATGSTDNFDSPGNLTYTWDFGDNSTPVKGQVVNHTYIKPGVYQAKLNVTDQAGNWWTTESSPLTVRGVNLAVTSIYYSVADIEEGKKLKFQVNVTNSQFGQNSGADASDITVTVFVGSKLIGTKTIESLEFEDFEILNFTWKAEKGGSTQTIRANVTMSNPEWELSWDDNERERKIDVTEPETEAALYIAIILIIVVIVIFALIFLRRRGLIGAPRSRKRDKDKKKGKKK
jgi:PKD repeat protein